MTDILLHALVAALIVLFLGARGILWAWGSAILTSLGFLLREEIQAYIKLDVWISPLRWSNQKLAEGWVPVGVALLIALVWHYYHYRKYAGHRAA